MTPKTFSGHCQMKWFFLGAILLFGLLFNAVAIDAALFWRAPSLIAVNAALLGLGFIWHGAYFEAELVNANSKDTGLALLCISVGLFISMGGLSAVLSDSCAAFFSERSYRLRNAIARFIESVGYCAELGYIVLIAGVLIMLIGLKRGFLVIRSRGLL
jgi:hypothetical protein